VERGARHQQLARVQQLQAQEGRRGFRLAQEVRWAVFLAEQPHHQLDRQQAAHCVLHLNEANNGQEDPAATLSPKRQPALQARLSGRQCNLSVRRRHRLNRVSSKKADSAPPLDLDRLVVRQALRSKGAVKLSELSLAGHPPVPVRVNVAAAQSKDNRVTVNLALHLAVQAPARREAEKSLVNLAPINLQPRRLLVPVRAKREAHEREDKAPVVNPPGSQGADRQLRLSKGRGSPQRKKERGLHRPGLNNSC